VPLQDATLERMAARLLSDPSLFSRFVLGRPLRAHQREPARAIVAAVLAGRGDLVSVVMARGAGKSELSAHVEAYLLNLRQRHGGQIVKLLPPDARLLGAGVLRLEWALQNPLNFCRWRSRDGVVGLGAASVRFAQLGRAGSGRLDRAALALEVDEAQAIARGRHEREVAPPAARLAGARVYYGTPWRSDDLVQRTKELAQALERRDGLRRHFEYPWWTVAERDPGYARLAEAERARLGDDHPLFRTQYRLLPLEPGEAPLLPTTQRALMRGDHPRLDRPRERATYVAGVSLGRAGRGDGPVVATIARVAPVAVADGAVEPAVEVVEHRRWAAGRPATWRGELGAWLADVWGCSRLGVIGPWSDDGAALGPVGSSAVVRTLEPTDEAVSRACFALLGAVDGGRFRMYRPDGGDDGCPSAFWRQAEHGRYAPLADRRIGLRVPGAEAEGDFVVSAALCVWVARDLLAAPAGPTDLPAAVAPHEKAPRADRPAQPPQARSSSPIQLRCMIASTSACV
jgi:hypothetical protein